MYRIDRLSKVSSPQGQTPRFVNRTREYPAVAVRVIQRLDQKFRASRTPTGNGNSVARTPIRCHHTAVADRGRAAKTGVGVGVPGVGASRLLRPRRGLAGIRVRAVVEGQSQSVLQVAVATAAERLRVSACRVVAVFGIGTRIPTATPRTTRFIKTRAAYLWEDLANPLALGRLKHLPGDHEILERKAHRTKLHVAAPSLCGNYGLVPSIQPLSRAGGFCGEAGRRDSNWPSTVGNKMT